MTVRIIEVEGGDRKPAKGSGSKIVGIEDMSRQQGGIAIFLSELCKHPATTLRALQTPGKNTESP